MAAAQRTGSDGSVHHHADVLVSTPMRILLVVVLAVGTVGAVGLRTSRLRDETGADA